MLSLDEIMMERVSIRTCCLPLVVTRDVIHVEQVVNGHVAKENLE